MRTLRITSVLKLAASAALLMSGIAGCPKPDGETTGDGATAAQNPPGTTGGTTDTSGGGAGSGAPAPTPVITPIPTPTPPTASAGADQAAEDGDTVTLTGTGADAAGAAVTFSWKQISGTPVTLSNPSAAQTTFVAPAASGELSFELTVTSAAGGAAADTVGVRIAAAPFLFVTNLGDGANVASFRVAKATAGDVAPRTLLAGANARLATPTGLVLDAHGSMLVCNADSNRIHGFVGGVAATGDVTPDRVVSNPGAELVFPQGMALDPATDDLYVANFDGIPAVVNVYDNGSDPNFSGRVPPLRRIRSFAMQNPSAVRLVGGSLYVSNAGSHAITVFDNAASLDGEVPATRLITGTDLQDSTPVDFVVDAQDRLFVVNGNRPMILVFDKASTRTGDTAPAAILTIRGAVMLRGIAVDSRGTAYITDNSANSIYIIENIGGRATGTIDPDRTLSGAATKLSAPWHMLLMER